MLDLIEDVFQALRGYWSPRMLVRKIRLLTSLSAITPFPFLKFFMYEWPKVPWADRLRVGRLLLAKGEKLPTLDDEFDASAQLEEIWNRDSE